MTEQQRYRIHSHLTKTRFLHLEDALDIGKVRLFAGQYRRGQGAQVTAHHFLDVADARVLFSDLAWGKRVDFCEYKGSPANGDNGPTSRVLKVRTNDGKVWVQVANGPGAMIGEGAVKPAGDPEAVVNVPLTTWEARRLAHAILAHLAAWDVMALRGRMGR